MLATFKKVYYCVTKYSLIKSGSKEASVINKKNSTVWYTCIIYVENKKYNSKIEPSEDHKIGNSNSDYHPKIWCFLFVR